MAYEVDRVVICEAFAEPDCHYELLPGGRSRLVQGRRPSRTYFGTANDARKGLRAVLGGEDQAAFDFAAASTYSENEFINELRDKVRDWRTAGYPGTAKVTRSLLEWWFEREEERRRDHCRLFFCQQEAIETLIYLFEVGNARLMPETEYVRYALKLATGTGKTLVMALVIVWSTLHKRKVSGSPLAATFLVLVPNLTVLSRVSGDPRGDGLDPAGNENLYKAFDLVPPDYADEFRPTVLVRNWQAISLDSKRDDWVGSDTIEEGALVPYSVLHAMRRRAQRDPKYAIRKLLRNRREVLVINDEAHHVYGEKRTRKGEEPAHIKWSKILDLVRSAARVPLVVDLTATPWYGSGSPKPEGQLFEWVVCDFSVYDAFEAGLVKVVRLPDPEGAGRQLIDLWDSVKGAKNKEDYLSACKGAIAAIYSSWKAEYEDWKAAFEFARGPQPVLLCVADRSKSADWVYEHLTRDFDLLANPSDAMVDAVTVRIDSKVFESEAGKMRQLREIVDTVGKPGAAGERVRCIVSVNMLSEGWDVKSVTHILGLRAFGSPLLTEQVVGRGLRRTSYAMLYEPLDDRPQWRDETVDAFGVPFVGFPVQRRKRSKKKGRDGKDPFTIQPSASKKAKFRIRVPNVRSWALGVSHRLSDVIDVQELPEIRVNPKDTPAQVTVRPVVGGKPEAVMTLDQFRDEYPLLRTVFLVAAELLDRTSPSEDAGLLVGPTFEELLELTQEFVTARVRAVGASDVRDVGIYYWRQRVISILETAIRAGGVGMAEAIPILGSPEYIDTDSLRPFAWYGPVAKGAAKTCTNAVPCDSSLEVDFANFLDSCRDVERYVKNERLRYSITYYESNRARQYFPDFVVKLRTKSGGDLYWVVETKGEVFPNTHLKREAARLWCQRLSGRAHGTWRFLFVQQIAFEKARKAKVKTFADLVDAMVNPPAPPQLALAYANEGELHPGAFESHLPVYSLRAAAGGFGPGEGVEPEGWLKVAGFGTLSDKLFVARATGRSMEPKIYDGEYCVFRASARVSEGRIVLAQWRGPEDPDSGGSYAVKIYSTVREPSPDGAQQVRRVVLSPLNPDYEPIHITEDDGDQVSVVATFVGVIRPE